MKQLTGLDASFLYMETGSQFGHVSGLSILEPPQDAGYDPFTAWRSQIEARLHLLEPLRRRVIDVPLRLDHPFWIEDPDFDLDFHVRHSAVPPPGRLDQLAEVVARLVGRPLDRNHPLWESYVIEGVEGGRFAVLTKVHHATVDGASGVELLTMMLDATPEPADVPEATDDWRPERLPTDFEVLGRAMVSLARKPGRLMVLSARTARALGQATRNPVLTATAKSFRESLRGPVGAILNVGRRREPDVDRPAQPITLQAPRTPFNHAITPHRKLALRSTPLSQVKAIKNALGATVNDVVMAACAGGLRAYLQDRDALPAEPLVAMVPVSIRTGAEPERWTNRVSGVVAALPTDEEDPLQRVKLVHESMGNAKELFQALPAEDLMNFSQFAPPAVFARAMRVATRLRPPVNLVISNVPGPREPLYVAGAQLIHYYPVSTIVDGQGLNITVQSYLDTLDFGLVGCRELLPDLDELADAIVTDLDKMAAAAGV